LQVADFRHGVRRIKGAIAGELSPKTYSDPISAMLKRDFTAGATASGVSVTVGGSAGAWTITRDAGSFLTDEFKIGDVIRLSVAALAAANLNKNLMIIGLTATVATVLVLNASALVPEGPVSGATVTVQGKKTWIPTSGHTDPSFSLEHWFGDIEQSELFSGIKFDKCAFNLPPTGLATVSLDVVGHDVTNAEARYFTSPTAVSGTGVVAAVNGVLVVGGVAQSVVTGLSISLDPAFAGDPVVGSNTVPAYFAGPVHVSGQFTAYFTDSTLRDLFGNETEAAILIALTTDNSPGADFLSIALPRIKVGGQQKSDGAAGIVQTFPFTALLNVAGGPGLATELTTISMQDSAA
jgi:hypothetical protein